jgi:sulfite reductase beta subunit-like hemoprotein
MSIECGICEGEARSGHAADCPRHPSNREKSFAGWVEYNRSPTVRYVAIRNGRVREECLTNIWDTALEVTLALEVIVAEIKAGERLPYIVSFLIPRAAAALAKAKGEDHA